MAAWSPPRDGSRAPPSALRPLIPLVARHRSLVVVWLAALVLAAAATLAVPAAARVMIDGFAEAGPAGLRQGALFLVAVALVLALGSAVRFYSVSLLAERVMADLRRAVYNRLLSLDLAFYESARSGDLLSRLAGDTELLRTVVASTASIALRSAVTLVGSAVAIVLTSPGLAGVALLVVPLVVVPIVVFGRRVRALSRQSQDRSADANARADETLLAIFTVQSYARESYERERFGDAIAVALATARLRIATQAWLTGTVILLVFGAIAGVLYLGAGAVGEGAMSAGSLGQFVLYAAVGAGSVGSLSEVWATVQRAAGGMSRLAEILDASPTVRPPAKPRALPPAGQGRVELSGVDFAYPSHPERLVLRDFTLRVEPGETVALVGPSGAGKSTVLSLLLRFYDRARGTIAIDGVDVAEVDPAALRSRIALVPQDPVLFGTDVMANIRYGRLDATDDDVARAAEAAEAKEFIEALPGGFTTHVGERGVRLSGGQKQRLAIARALLKDAPILLLDEATSSLDAHSEHAVQQALERLMVGRTTLVIAHRLATVRRADRIVVLQDGAIVAEGTHDQLVAESPLYASLARLQLMA